MSSPTGDTGKLRAELDRLAHERRWAEIRDRLADREDAELAAEPKLAFYLAEAFAHLGVMERALTLVLAAEAEFRSRHDRINLMEALNLAGAVQFELGDLSGAQGRFAELLELARESGEEEMSGRATNNLGAIATLRSEYGRALSLYRLSIPAYQKVGHAVGLAQTEHNLGIVYRDLGYWREADGHYRRAIERARQVGDDRLVAMATVGRAEISHRRGDLVYAEAEAARGLQTFQVIGDELGRADALRLLGAVAASRGELEEAAEALEEALDLAREHANPLLEAEVLEERAGLHRRHGRDGLAGADLTLAATIYRKLGAAERARRVESYAQG